MRSLLAVLTLTTVASTQDLAYVRAALEDGAARLPEVEQRWRARMAGALDRDASFEHLFGYDPPGQALRLASLAAFLYEVEGRGEDAARAARLLRRMADYRAEVPAELLGARAEYAAGLPAVPSFFHLADYAEAWSRVAAAPNLDPETREVVREALAGSAEFVFTFPEWGAHNRAVLRAEGLAHAARALPVHPRAGAWRRMGAVLVADSRGQWEIEDASHYQAIWLLAMLRYGDVSGDHALLRDPSLHLQLRNLLALLTPRGTLPAYGDAWFDGGLGRLYACFRWGAARFGDPELAWAADRVAEAMGPLDMEAPSLARADLCARLWGIEGPEARAPGGFVRPEQLVAKKFVARAGWGPDAFYLCLNYKDEGDDALAQRDYLRQTLAVVEEKMHHGHEDENSIVLFMDEGSVLLHDGGYRDVAPSGPNGAWRADHFHNRVIRRPHGAEWLDSGAYQPVRTRCVDRVELEQGGQYSRTRVEADGYVWDRVLVVLPAWRTVLVVDHLVEGEGNFAQLWAAQDVLERGPGYARTRYRSVGTHALPTSRELVLLMPGSELPPVKLEQVRHRQNEQLLVREFGGRGDATALTVLRSVRSGTSAQDVAATVTPLDAGAGATALRLSDGRRRLTVLLKLDLDRGLSTDDVRPRYSFVAGVVRAGETASDGDLTLVHEGPAGGRWEAVNATRVERSGRTVFEASALNLFQTSGRSDVVGRVEWRHWGGPLGD